jgi:phosphate transport system permease protein
MADRETVSHRGSGDDPGGEATGRGGGTPGSPADPLPPPSIGGEPIDWVERGFDASLPIGSAQPTAIGTFEQGAGRPGRRGRSRAAVGGPGSVTAVFAFLTTGSGLFIVLLILLVAIFLVAKAVPAIADNQVNFLFSREWSVEGGTLRFGVVDLLWVTVIISLIAMLIAVPIAIGIALFITFYAPRRLARPVAYVVDLLAAIPSIIYGIWGITVLAPKLAPVQRALYHIPGPVFAGQERRGGHDLQRRHRARDNDLADHHRDQPRRV